MIFGVYDSCPHGTAAPWFTFPEAQWMIVLVYALHYSLGILCILNMCQVLHKLASYEKLQPVKNRRATTINNIEVPIYIMAQ